jgi:hypothetical protein
MMLIDWIFLKILFPEDNKSNLEEISKLLPGDYEFKSKESFSVRSIWIICIMILIIGLNWIKTID